ncbi:MAG: type II toxin-antitoxin system VapC family toxin [Actinomycetales bacterium]
MDEQVTLTRLDAGLLDTSVVIDLERIDPGLLPARVAISAITLAELAAGPSAAKDPAERARRQDRLQRAEAAFEPIPFDAQAARAYGRVHAAVVTAGRHPRRRFADLLIAATALGEGLPLVTRNPDDFVGLRDLLDILTV